MQDSPTWPSTSVDCDLCPSQTSWLSSCQWILIWLEPVTSRVLHLMLSKVGIYRTHACLRRTLVSQNKITEGFRGTFWRRMSVHGHDTELGARLAHGCLQHMEGHRQQKRSAVLISFTTAMLPRVFSCDFFATRFKALSWIWSLEMSFLPCNGQTERFIGPQLRSATKVQLGISWKSEYKKEILRSNKQAAASVVKLSGDDVQHERKNWHQASTRSSNPRNCCHVFISIIMTQDSKKLREKKLVIWRLNHCFNRFFSNETLN